MFYASRFNIQNFCLSTGVYTCSSLFARPYLAVSQIRGVSLRIKTYYSNPLVARSIKIVWQLELFFEPYRMMFKEL